MFKITIIGLFAILFFGNHECMALPSDTYECDEDDIWVGPAAILSCRNIILFRYHHDGAESDSVILSEGDKNFSRTKTWIFKHFFGVLNKKRSIADRSYKFCLSLNSRPSLKGSSPADILLTIPLSQDTLGVDYDQKILELRKVMTDDRP